MVVQVARQSGACDVKGTLVVLEEGEQVCPPFQIIILQPRGDKSRWKGTLD